MSKPLPHPLVPPSMPGWAWGWCQERELSVWHPERWPTWARAEYEFLTGESAPTRSPYRATCPCHPMRLGLLMNKDRDPWLMMPGATRTAQCLTWLRREFGGTT